MRTNAAIGCIGFILLAGIVLGVAWPGIYMRALAIVSFTVFVAVMLWGLILPDIRAWREERRERQKQKAASRYRDRGGPNGG